MPCTCMTLTGMSLCSGPLVRQPVAWLIAPGTDRPAHVARLIIGGRSIAWASSGPLPGGCPLAEFAAGDAPLPDAGGTGTEPENSQETGLPGGTMIATDDGELPVDWLRPGDRVLTRDNGYRPLLGVRKSSPAGRDPAAMVEIPAHRFGRGLPSHTVRLPRDHGVLLADPQLDLHFGSSEMFADAGDLGDRAGLARVPAAGPCYLLIFETHEIILAENLWVESVAAKTMARAEPGGAGSPMTNTHRVPEAELSARPRLAAWELGIFECAQLILPGRRAA